MNHKIHTTSNQSEPHRHLRADFTTYTLRRATTAKRRATAKLQIKAFFKEPFSMKSLTFLRTAPGAALAVAIIATTSAGAYALANWFNADVTVTQSNSVLSVDLSGCKGNLPSGIESNSDRHNVQFRILENPHISAANLQQNMLAECEYQAVVSFYHSQPATASVSLRAGKVAAISDSTVRLAYQWGGRTVDKTFSLTPNTTVYDQGSPVPVNDLRPGDTIIFATQNQQVPEGVDPLADTNDVLSIFKTQYNPGQAMSASKNGFYEDNNIMPLDMYNRLHK
jgi:hypothetical protein